MTNSASDLVCTTTPERRLYMKQSRNATAVWTVFTFCQVGDAKLLQRKVKHCYAVTSVV